MDGSPFDISDFEVALRIGDGDGGQLEALFREDLDALVEEVVVEVVVVCLSAVEIDRCDAGVFGVGGGREFVGSGVLELAESGMGKQDNSGKKYESREASHAGSLSRGAQFGLEAWSD